MTGIIVDGVHVSYEMVRMAYEFMPESLYLFTDRFTDCAAMNVSYDDEQDCFVRTATDGRKIICGSALSMIKAVRNSVEYVGISMEKAVQMVLNGELPDAKTQAAVLKCAMLLSSPVPEL